MISDSTNWSSIGASKLVTVQIAKFTASTKLCRNQKKMSVLNKQKIEYHFTIGTWQVSSTCKNQVQNLPERYQELEDWPATDDSSCQRQCCQHHWLQRAQCMPWWMISWHCKGWKQAMLLKASWLALLSFCNLWNWWDNGIYGSLQYCHTYTMRHYSLTQRRSSWSKWILRGQQCSCRIFLMMLSTPKRRTLTSCLTWCGIKY